MLLSFDIAKVRTFLELTKHLTEFNLKSSTIKKKKGNACIVGELYKRFPYPEKKADRLDTFSKNAKGFLYAS